MGQSNGELADYVADRVAKAEAGQPSALYDLGLLYSTGQGVGRNIVEAHKWFNLAAQSGVRRAKVDCSELAQEMKRKDVAEANRQARLWLDQHRA